MNTLSMDSKGRICVPKYYRRKLGLDANSIAILTLDPKNRIVLFSENVFYFLLDEFFIVEFESVKVESKLRSKKYAVGSKIDRRGRIILPATLREKNNADKTLYVRINLGVSATWMVISADKDKL